MPAPAAPLRPTTFAGRSTRAPRRQSAGERALVAQERQRVAEERAAERARAAEAKAIERQAQAAAKAAAKERAAQEKKRAAEERVAARLPKTAAKPAKRQRPAPQRVRQVVQPPPPPAAPLRSGRVAKRARTLEETGAFDTAASKWKSSPLPAKQARTFAPPPEYVVPGARVVAMGSFGGGHARFHATVLKLLADGRAHVRFTSDLAGNTASIALPLIKTACEPRLPPSLAHLPPVS
eukprot:3060346-Prymnesium_polylepis.1